MKHYKLDNLHILLWLLKDLSWLMLLKELGIFMIFPTLLVAMIITWKNRKNTQDLFHNLAMTFWIIANSSWMIFEFIEMDELRIYSVVPFAFGIGMIFYYWIDYFLRLASSRRA